MLAEAAKELLDQFKAVTFDWHQLEGRWRHEGDEYHDELVRAIVDVPETTSNRVWMTAFKQRWRRRLKQLELWVISYRIDVE